MSSLDLNKLSNELNSFIFTFGEEVLSRPVTPIIPVFSSLEEIEHYASEMFQNEFKVPSVVYMTREAFYSTMYESRDPHVHSRPRGFQSLHVNTSVGPIQIYIY